MSRRKNVISLEVSAPVFKANFDWNEMNDMDTSTLHDMTSIQRLRNELSNVPRAERLEEIVNSIPDDGPFRIKVQNINYNCNEGQLEQFFHPLKLANVHMAMDRAKGGHRGFGYVEFHTREDLIQGLQMNARPLSGRPVRIELAPEKADYGGGDKTTGRSYNNDSGPRNERFKEGYRSSGGNFSSNEGPSSAQTESNWRSNLRPSAPPPVQEKFDDRNRFNDYEDRGARRGGKRGGRDGPDKFSGRRGGYVPQTVQIPEPVHERVPLKLEPRKADLPAADVTRSTQIFGAAKPVDTTAKELEIEKKLENERALLRQEVQKKQEMEGETGEGYNQHVSPNNRSRHSSQRHGSGSRSRFTSTTSSAGGDFAPRGRSLVSSVSFEEGSKLYRHQDGGMAQENVSDQNVFVRNPPAAGFVQNQNVNARNYSPDDRSRQISERSSSIHSSDIRAQASMGPVVRVPAPPPTINAWTTKRLFKSGNQTENIMVKETVQAVGQRVNTSQYSESDRHLQAKYAGQQQQQQHISAHDKQATISSERVTSAALIRPDKSYSYAAKCKLSLSEAAPAMSESYSSATLPSQSSGKDNYEDYNSHKSASNYSQHYSGMTDQKKGYAEESISQPEYSYEGKELQNNPKEREQVNVSVKSGYLVDKDGNPSRPAVDNQYRNSRPHRGNSERYGNSRQPRHRNDQNYEHQEPNEFGRRQNREGYHQSSQPRGRGMRQNRGGGRGGHYSNSQNTGSGSKSWGSQNTWHSSERREAGMGHEDSSSHELTNTGIHENGATKPRAYGDS